MAKSIKKQQMRAMKKQKARDEKRRQIRHNNRTDTGANLDWGPNGGLPPHTNASASQDEMVVRTSIQKFILHKRFADEFERALPLFFGEGFSQTHMLNADAAATADFQEWYFFDYLTTTGEYLIDLFIRQIGPSLSLIQQQIAEDWERTNRLRLLEVQEVTPGVGEVVQDLVNGELLHCNDISMSLSARRWQIIIARPILTEERWHFTGSGVLLTPLQKPHIVKFAKGLWEEYQAQNADATIESFYRRHGLQVRKYAEEVQRQASNPKYVSAEGHSIIGAKAEYQLADESEILDLLDKCEEFVYAGGSEERENAYHYNWLLRGRSIAPESLKTPEHALILRNQWTLGPGQPSYLTLGDLNVWPEGLELSCISRERLQSGKQLLEDLLGDRIRHHRDRFDNILAEAKRSPQRSIARKDRQLRGEALVVEHETMAREFEKWLETPVSALGDFTPRQAVKNVEGRAALQEMLKAFEYIEAENPKLKETPFSAASIRRELGLD